MRAWTRRDRSAAERWPHSLNPLLAIWSVQKPSYGPRVSWAIDVDGETIGRITLRDVLPSEARIGIYLREDRCGAGFGTEALRLFCDLAFAGLGFERLRLDVAASNHRALRCYRSGGFREVGREWRPIGNDPALGVLAFADYAHLRCHFHVYGDAGPRAEYIELVRECDR